jgi:hypothetical protein
MTDPRNVAHAKKVTQQKHHDADASAEAATVAQPGKKSATAKKKHDPANVTGEGNGASVDESAASPGLPTPMPPEALQGSLVVLTKLKEVEFHSRASLERLAELALTVEDELKQQAIVGLMNDVYSAQSTLQTKLTALLEVYKAECDRLQAVGA